MKRMHIAIAWVAVIVGGAASLALALYLLAAAWSDITRQAGPAFDSREVAQAIAITVAIWAIALTALTAGLRRHVSTTRPAMRTACAATIDAQCTELLRRRWIGMSIVKQPMGDRRDGGPAVCHPECSARACDMHSAHCARLREGRRVVTFQRLSLEEMAAIRQAAREAADRYLAPEAKGFWHNPAFWISLVLLAMPLLLLVDVFFVHPESYDTNLRTQIVTGVLMVISIVGGFWLGSSMGSQKKTEALTK